MIPIRAVIDEYLATKEVRVTHKTLDWYTIFLEEFGEWSEAQEITSLSQINAPVVNRFVAAAKTTNSNTRHHRAQIVKGFLRWCADDEVFGVREKVVKRIELPKPMQPDVVIFSKSDIDKLMNACDGTSNPHRNRALLHILLDTGVRASELCYDGKRPDEETGLRKENLILVRGTESYVRVMGRGRKPRTVGIGHETSLAVQRYLNRERGHSDSDYVFLGSTGAPLSVRMLEQTLDALGKKTGVGDCHPHRFRHTFAIHQLMNGTSSLVLMQLLGHTTLESTKMYTRALTEIRARQSSTSVVDTMRGGGKKPKAARSNNASSSWQINRRDTGKEQRS